MEIDKTKNEKSQNIDIEGNTNRKGEGQMYDKIMRENLLELFLPLVMEQMNVKIKKVSPLPDKQPSTVIRETDAFLLVETYSKSEPKFILHIEFESSDDEEMIYRILEHHGLELRKYRLPMKHVVVYLGETTPKMRTKLYKTEVFEGFTLVNAFSFSPEKWLEQEEPAKIIMAILGNYQKQNAKIILNAIFEKLRKVCKTETELKKFIKQLVIISRMRKLEELTIKVSKEMPLTIDIKTDYLYNLGLQEAAEKLKKAKKQLKQFAKEKAAIEAKAAQEAEAKRKAEAKAREEKKIAVQKMRATSRFSDEEIIDFLNLDKKQFNIFLKEIENTDNTKDY